MRILLGALTLAIGVIAFLNLNGGAQTLQDIPLASGTEKAPVVAKDLGIVLNIAEQSSFPAPITQAALGQYQAAAALGLGTEDDAAVATRVHRPQVAS